MHLALAFPIPGVTSPQELVCYSAAPGVLSYLNPKRISHALEGRNTPFLQSMGRSPVLAPAQSLSPFLPAAGAGLQPRLSACVTLGMLQLPERNPPRQIL